MFLKYTKENHIALDQEIESILNEGTNKQLNPDTYVPGIVLGVTNNVNTEILKAKGLSCLEKENRMTEDSLFAIFSCTKAIVSCGILQLWERDLIDLDSPVKNYLPRISNIGIIRGYKEDGSPVFVKPKTEVTMRMLLTHTSGFSYPFFNKDYKRLCDSNGQPSFVNFTEETLDSSFLLFEPGSQWTYGMSIDWAGKVLEAITGMSLGDYLYENIFKPANMESCSFYISEEVNKERLATIYTRTHDGLIKSPFQPLKTPSIELGGHGLFATVEDYLKFIRIWLNKGKTPDGVQIIKSETYDYAIRNQLPSGMSLRNINSCQQEITKDFVLDPYSASDKWNLAFSLTEDDLHTGRPQGSFHWSGIANLYYWIDPINKLSGFYASQIFPMGDVSAANFTKIESAVYNHLE